MTEKKSILEEALELTRGSRQKDYGHPVENFTKIANLWTAYLENKDECVILTPKDVALMMILFKVAREQSGHKRDNLVDIAGYASTTAMVEGLE